MIDFGPRHLKFGSLMDHSRTILQVDYLSCDKWTFSHSTRLAPSTCYITTKGVIRAIWPLVDKPCKKMLNMHVLHVNEVETTYMLPTRKHVKDTLYPSAHCIRFINPMYTLVVNKIVPQGKCKQTEAQLPCWA